MISLGSKSWGSSPTIGMSFAYEKQRSGADMQYRAKVTINALTGAGYFGYPIYLKLYIGGTLRVTTTLKSASPSQWSSAITYTSSWYTVENKTSGTTAVSFNVYSGSGSSRNATYSYNMAVDAASSALSVSNGTLGTAQALTVTRYDDSFTHTITYVCGNDEGTICSKSSNTSVSWTPPLVLAENAPNGTVATIALTLTTYDGDTSIGTSTKTITAAIPSSVVPTVSLSVSDSTGYLSTYGGYVQGKSKPKVTATAAGAYGSSIRGYSTTIDGDSYTEETFTASALKSSGTLTVKTTVTDSRGRTATDSTAITVLAYASPKVSAITVQRCNSDGTAASNGAYLKVTFSAAITSLSGKNTAAYKVQYKKTSATSYTSATLSNYAGNYSVTNGTYIFAADTAASYDVILTATDAFSSATKGCAGSAVSKFFSWFAGGLGWAFGKTATKANTLDIGWDVEMNGNTISDYSTEPTAINVTAVGQTDAALQEIFAGMAAATEKSVVLKQSVVDGLPVGGTWFVTISKTNDNYGALRAIRYYSSGDVPCMECVRSVYAGTWSAWSNEHKHQYVTSAGSFRLAEGWMGLYDTLANAASHTNRKGWIGYDGDTSMMLVDGAGGGVALKSSGSIRFYGGNSTSSVAVLVDRLRASGNDIYYLGDSSNRWKAVYAVNGTIQTSDRNQKKNIEELGQKYIDLFDRLMPVSFMFNDAESDRVHIGFISQDVKVAMDEVGLTDLDFAGFCCDVLTEWDEETQSEKTVVDEKGDPVYLYSLRYSEFIALNSKMIQINRKKITEQAEEIAKLRDDVAALKKAVAELGG